MTKKIEISLDQLRSLRWVPGPYGDPFAVFGEFVLTRARISGWTYGRCADCCSNYAAKGVGRIRWMEWGCIGNGPPQAALSEEVRCGGPRGEEVGYRILELSKHPEYLTCFGPKAAELLVSQERPQLSLF